MTTSSTKSDFLLLFRGSNWHAHLSPEEIQTTMTAWRTWFDGLVAQGSCKGGHPLQNEGKIVSGKGRTVSDGPFAESKEAIAGYFYLEVENLDEAVEIAKGCPALDYGITVEVRAIQANCGAAHQAAQECAHAEA